MRSYLTAGVAALLVGACGGGSGGSGGGAGGGSSNSPPSFSPPSAVDYEEGAGTDILNLSASDADGDSISFSIGSGKDGSFFSLSGTALTFNQELSFETPQDGDRDNVYEVDVTASDGTASVTRTISVTILNSNEGVEVVRIASFCGGASATAIDPVFDTQLLIACRDGEVYLHDTVAGTSELLIDTTVQFGNHQLIDAHFYDAILRRWMFFVVHSAGDYGLYSFTEDFSSGSRELVYETEVAAGAPSFTSTGLLAADMSNCLNAELCLLVGDLNVGPYINALTAFDFSLDGGGNLQWVETELVSGMSASKAMTRNGREYYITQRDNSAIDRYDFDDGTLTYEVDTSDVAVPGLGSIQYYDGVIDSLTGKALFTDDAAQVLTVDMMLLSSGTTDRGMGIENRSLDFTPDAGTINGPAEITRLLDKLYLLDTADGELFEVRAAN